MSKVFISGILFTCFIGSGVESISPPHGNRISVKSLAPDPIFFEPLINIIAIIESNNNSQAIGDSGKAVGTYQLHKIFVDDVNRIIGSKKYSYADRLNPTKSREMVKIYLQHYATQKRLCHKPTCEDMARIINGGPNGYKKKSTVKYWSKVKKILENKK